MFKVLSTILIGFIVSSASLFAHGSSGGQLLERSQSDIFMLTPPSNSNTGGTGFALQTPSGDIYTVTNAHICELAESGYLDARRDGQTLGTLIEILEVSTTTDLCILTGVPGSEGLRVAEWMDRYELITVIGHPRLKPLTVSQGYFVSRTIVDVVDSEAVACDGPSRSIQTIPGPFGTVMQVCVASVDAYDTSIVIYGGNSGSPAMNLSGGVIGVVFAGDTQTNQGALIPLDVLQEFVANY